MNIWYSLMIIMAAFAGSMFFSGLETGGYLLNRIRLRARVRRGEPSALRLQESLRDAHRFIFTVLIGNNIANYLLSREVTRLYSETAGWNAETAATLTLMLPLFLFCELIPKNIFRHQADVLMYRFAGLLRLSQRVFAPATVFLKMFFNLLTGGRGRREERSGFTLSLQGFREYFAEDTRRVTLSEHQHGMIDNLIAMHRVPLKEVMRPVAHVATVPLNTTAAQALKLMRTNNVEQLVVYAGSVHHVVGVINLFDLMNPALQSSDGIKAHLHKLIRLSSEVSLTDAFCLLRQSSGIPAVVTDRAARAVGLLHLSDIARYIVQG